jgi:hypothetical protein
MTAGSPHGPWRLSNSPALAIAFPNVASVTLGLPSLVLRKSSNPPNRRMRTRTYGDVGGAASSGVPLSRFSSTPPALDHNTISSTRSKRQSAAPSRMTRSLEPVIAVTRNP